ncbi:Glutamine amidotransferase, class I [hydrothermal vent metagenome]|uniref:Glutamine amidotransferase, class I n=1 Tax=hydrothermal vent metagenome TaxID=652676 RepID=A0A3B0Z8U6_9ZZZZ
MKLGLLQCDSVVNELQPEFGNYPAMFIRLFQEIDPAVCVHIYDVERGEYPVTPHECDAYITTGSKASVYEDLPWLIEFKAFLRILYVEKIKLVGICFGHQLIAEVFGGKTEKSDKGWGVGVSVNRVIEYKSWMQPSLDTLQIIVSHQDQVTRLPDDAQLLVTSDFCPNYMYQLGESMLALQGHPEFSKSYAKKLMYFRENKIGGETFRTGLNSLQRETNEKVFAQWLLNFFKT